MDNNKTDVHPGDSVGLKSKEGDITCAFLHADLEPGENIYVDMPLGFSQYLKDGTKKCLKLKKTLYGLWQSPRAFWKYIFKKTRNMWFGTIQI